MSCDSRARTYDSFLGEPLMQLHADLDAHCFTRWFVYGTTRSSVSLDSYDASDLDD